MTFDEMYALTPRSFFNAVNGQRKKEDAFSKERWIMTREIMYAVMKPYIDEGIEKHDVLTFEWEKQQLQKIAAERQKTIFEDLERMNDFWERQDNAKAEQTVIARNEAIS
jgi:hypothetical protein